MFCRSSRVRSAWTEVVFRELLLYDVCVLSAFATVQPSILYTFGIQQLHASAMLQLCISYPSPRPWIVVTRTSIQAFRMPGTVELSNEAQGLLKHNKRFEGIENVFAVTLDSPRPGSYLTPTLLIWLSNVKGKSSSAIRTSCARASPFLRHAARNDSELVSSPPAFLFLDSHFYPRKLK